MPFKNFLKAGLIVLILLSCKKEVTNTNAPASIGPNDKVVVFTNASDPRLAQVETKAGKRVLFFGRRDESGKPIQLTGYSVCKMPDSAILDFVNFDDEGRYSNFVLHTGEKLHLNYDIPDSVQIILSGPDSVLVKVTKPYYSSKHKIIGRVSTSGISGTRGILGSDNNINIKVTAKNISNTANPTEEDLRSDEAIVTLKIVDVPRFDWELEVPYDDAKGLYSIPIPDPTSGLNFSVPDALKETVEMIRSGLEFACLDPNPGQGIGVLDFLGGPSCLLGGPAAPVICPAIAALIIACHVDDIVTILQNIGDVGGDILKAIDPNYGPMSDNSFVTTVVNSIKYGRKSADPAQTLGTILSNPGPYDFKITFEYKDTSSLAGVWYDCSVKDYNGDLLINELDNIPNDSKSQYKFNSDGTGDFFEKYSGNHFQFYWSLTNQGSILHYKKSANAAPEDLIKVDADSYQHVYRLDSVWIIKRNL